MNLCRKKDTPKVLHLSYLMRLINYVEIARRGVGKASGLRVNTVSEKVFFLKGYSLLTGKMYTGGIEVSFCRVKNFKMECWSFLLKKQRIQLVKYRKIWLYVSASQRVRIQAGSVDAQCVEASFKNLSCELKSKGPQLSGILHAKDNIEKVFGIEGDRFLPGDVMRVCLREGERNVDNVYQILESSFDSDTSDFISCLLLSMSGYSST